jgi:hypothetical protein
VARINLFGRELRIDNQALRHPIAALRQRLDQPTFELRRRTNAAPVAPRVPSVPARVPFAPLEIGTGLTLTQAIRTREIADAAAEAGQRRATLRALGSLPRYEDLQKKASATAAASRPRRLVTESVDKFVPAQRRAVLTQRVHAIGSQLLDGPAIIGESHTSPDARAVILDMIEAGRVRELFLELGSLQLSDLGIDPSDIPGGGHDRTASDFLREHAGADLAGHPVWEALAEGMQWVDVHPNAIPLAQLINKAQAAGVAVYFYDNDPSHDRASAEAMSRRNEVAGREFQRSQAIGKAGTLLLVGGDHLSAAHCGGADRTIQTLCGVPPLRVHDLS